MSGPKRQHHLAQAMQRNFLAKDADKLWWYSRATKRYEERTPRSIAHARNTYTFTAIQGKERYTLEEAFSKLENEAVPALRRLAQSIELTQKEHNSISEFVAFQFLRTPAKLKVLQDIIDAGAKHTATRIAEEAADMTDEEYETLTRNFMANTGKKHDNIPKEVFLSALKQRGEGIRSTKEFRLKQMVELATDIGIEYSARSWVVIHNRSNKSFIASDEGVFLVHDTQQFSPGFGPLTRGVATILPISKDAVLLISSHRPAIVNHSQATSIIVDSINNGLATTSNEIYSHSKKLLESIVKRNNLEGSTFEIVLNDIEIERLIRKNMEKTR